MVSPKLAISATAVFVTALAVALLLTSSAKAERYEGIASLFVPIFLLVCAPPLRMARLGEYLRTYGLDSIGKRSSFQTRDDHFLLDYAIGRWFRHASFALGYLALAALYFVGWFLLGFIFFLVSIPLLAIILVVSKRVASHLLSPFDPTEVATVIESTYPTRPLKQFPAGSILIAFAFFYFVAIEYLSPNLEIFALLAIFYLLLILYFTVIRRRLAASHEPQ
jgi:hypothetical protein